MGSTTTKFCAVDTDCYLASASAAEKSKTCCAKYEITKLNDTLPNHAQDLKILKSYGFPDDKPDEGDILYTCNRDYPVTFGKTYMDGDVTKEKGAWTNAGIWFKAYCDGGETLAFVGKLTAATGMAYMSMY